MAAPTALTKVEQNASLQLNTLADVYSLGKVLSASGYFKDARDPAKAAVILIASKELGMSPIYGLMNMDVVDGRLTIRAHAIAALIKRSGRYDYKVHKADKTGADIEFFALEHTNEKGEFTAHPRRVSLGHATFGPEDAKQAGLNGKQNFQKHPADMYYARAISKGGRRFCPDVFLGAVYAEGEVPGEASFAQPLEDSAEDAPAPKKTIDATATVVKPTVEKVLPTQAAETPKLELEATATRVIECPATPEPEKIDAPAPPAPIDDLQSQKAAPDQASIDTAGGRMSAEKVNLTDAAPAQDATPAAPADTTNVGGDVLLATVSETLPIELAKTILALPSDAKIEAKILREVHAHLEEQLGPAGAKTAWRSVNVEVKKGAVVTKEQIVNLCRALSGQN